MKLFLTGSALALAVVIALPSKSGVPTPAADGLASQFPGSGEEAGQVGAAESGRLAEQALRQAERLRELEWDRDPFASAAPSRSGSPPKPESTPSSDPVLHLNGLAVVDGKALAVIGSEIVGPGDQLTTGHRVTSIESTRVHLDLDGETLVLSLEDRPSKPTK